MSPSPHTQDGCNHPTPSVEEAGRALDEARGGVEKLYSLISQSLSAAIRAEIELQKVQPLVEASEKKVAELEDKLRLSLEIYDRMDKTIEDCHQYLTLKGGPRAGKTLLERLKDLLLTGQGPVDSGGM